MRELILVLGDQLFAGLPGMPDGVPVVMHEDAGLATRWRHHQQKLVLFFSAMRHFAASLDREVLYSSITEQNGSMISRLSGFAPEKVWVYEPADAFFLRDVLRPWAAASGVELVVVPNPMFLTSSADWEAYAGRSKRRLMGDFYQAQRRRLGILMEDGQPVGGRWSFDEENRKALPKSVLPPPVHGFEPDSVTRQVISEVSRLFGSHPGDALEFRYGVTHADARAALAEFLAERLGRFGDYEDAIPQRERTLFHSVLTPYLNTGLLTPAEVVSAALRCQGVPLNSLEGFVRQVIGWREFIFWIGRERLEVYESWPNFFGHRRKLKACWYDGTTGLLPLDTVIRRTEKHAYCHHIERLMVLGSAMLMCEVDPQESYRWFMEMFIDSADWVMAPNVLGMSQFADGGVFATKPYLSGSAYILKMSDYPKGEWCDVWDGLYWRFIDRHLDFFASNHRMGMMVGGLGRLEPARRERIFGAAERFIERVTDPAE